MWPSGAGEGFTEQQRRELAVKAFRHTADYDVAVASWLGSVEADETFPGWVAATWQRAEVLRYGENPHAGRALYINEHGSGLAHAEQLHGKQMSYNNYVDGDAAYRTAWDFQGARRGHHQARQPVRDRRKATMSCRPTGAFDTDPVSAFGGVVAVNRPVTKDVAEAMADLPGSGHRPGVRARRLSVLTKSRTSGCWWRRRAMRVPRCASSPVGC